MVSLIASIEMYMGHLCEEDKEELAIYCCSCRFPPLPLCQAHSDKHKTNPGFHFLLPLEAIHLIRDPEMQDQWEGWFRHLATNYEQLKSQGPAFAACREQVEATFLEIVAVATSEKERLMFSIRRAEEKLAEAGMKVEEELREHVTDPTYYERASSELHKQVWGEDLRLEPLVTFSAQAHTDSIRTAFQVSLQLRVAGMEGWSIASPAHFEGQAELEKAREEIARLQARVDELEQRNADTPEQPPIQVQAVSALACVTNESVSFFNFDTRNWKSTVRFRSKIKCDGHSAFWPLNDSEVLVCGGGEPYKVWNSAYLLTISGKVLELPSLNSARFELSVVGVSDNIYALGGRNKEGVILEVEVLKTIAAEKWEVAGKLQEARLFSGVAVWQDIIYLCGGKDSLSIESFNPATGQSYLSPLTLEEPGYALALILDDQLVVLTRFSVLRVNRASKSTVTRLASNETKGSNTCPVVVGNSVFYVQSPWCYWLNTTTWKKEGEMRIKTSIF